MTLEPLIQYGVMGIMLFVFLKLHMRSLEAGQKREENLTARLEANRLECKADTADLVKRVQTLEDRSYRSLASALETSGDILKMNAEAFSRLTDTDRFPIRNHNTESDK